MNLNADLLQGFGCGVDHRADEGVVSWVVFQDQPSAISNLIAGLVQRVLSTRFLFALSSIEFAPFLSALFVFAGFSVETSLPLECGHHRGRLTSRDVFRFDHALKTALYLLEISVRLRIFAPYRVTEGQYGGDDKDSGDDADDRSKTRLLHDSSPMVDQCRYALFE